VIAEELPAGARDLIQRCLATMDHVEALLLLQANPGEDLTIQRAAQQLRLDDATATRVLSALTDAGLASDTGHGFRFIASPANTRDVNDLAHAYHVRPVTLVQAIYSRPAFVTSFGDVMRRRDDGAT